MDAQPTGKVEMKAGLPSAETAGPAPEVLPSRWNRSFSHLAGRLWQIKGRVAAITVTLTVAAWYLFSMFRGTTVPVATAVRADFIQSVVASGRVAAPFRVDVGAQIPGVVASVPVSEGQTVKSGDVLVVLDDREAHALVVQAEGVVAQSEAGLRQLQELTLPSAEQDLRHAQATLSNARKVLDRESRLQTAIAGIEVDEAKRNVDIAESDVRNAEYRVFTSRPGGSDHVLAEAQLNQARAALTTARLRFSYTSVRAPRDGTLIFRDVEQGNVVQAGQRLMQLSPSLAPELVVRIDEKNLSLIAIGQPALASADAYPGVVFPAEVAFINPGVDLQRASIEVKLRVPDPPRFLRQDMTVSVDIEVARHRDAVIVPVGVLQERTGDRTSVLKLGGGKAWHQPVQTGLVSGGQAEIITGLEPGDQVITGNTKSIREGERVRGIAPELPNQ